ncbi:DUF1016 family protein, partial [Myxococcota bacterium]|nr:DUF1016 family protein [Myxococcota bacterium]
VYPQIAKSLISQLSVLPRSVQSMISLVTCPDDQETGNCAFPGIPSERLPGVLSFTHFIELIKIEDPLKRSFYEVESVRGTWSVRELKRQIASLYFERSGLSRDKRRLAEIVDERVKSSTMQQAIQDPYVFEFLGLRPNEVMPESNLEQALLHQLEAFLLELGRGFCFEARQRRILIGDEYFFVDLVFYHRILKCHVLIELKSGGFSHEYLGQLNCYVSWYATHEMGPGDNPPVGILLCTEKNHALVKYALAGMNNQIFVSRYQLVLPEEEQMRAFIDARLEADVPPPTGRRRTVGGPKKNKKVSNR